MGSRLFTVFTPTYNRVATLHRLYHSLIQQSLSDFEWLIVDDGSTDKTSEIVQSWQEENRILIRYIYKENGGKHTAINVGVNVAQGEKFIIIDSDDTCPSQMLERFKYHWDTIPKDKFASFSSVYGLIATNNGKLVGNRYPQDVMCIRSFWEQYSLRASGDRLGSHRLDVLKKFPFPEYANEKFLAEGIIWNQLAKAYQAKFVNEILEICEYREDGLTNSSRKIRAKSPRGAASYYKNFFESDIPYLKKMRAIINFLRYAFHGKFGFKVIKSYQLPLIYLAILAPISFVIFLIDKNVYKASR